MKTKKNKIRKTFRIRGDLVEKLAKASNAENRTETAILEMALSYHLNLKH